MTRATATVSPLGRGQRFVQTTARTVALAGVILAAIFGYNTWAAIEASNPPMSSAGAAPLSTVARAAVSTPAQNDIALTADAQQPFTS